MWKRAECNDKKQRNKDILESGKYKMANESNL